METTQVPRQLGENVQVLVRSRPMNHREEKDGQQNVVKCLDKQKQITVQLKANKYLSKNFYFDAVFGPEATQRDLFVSAIRPIVEEVLNGYNCTIFAYGTTGTGKTYTMEGPRGSMDANDGVKTMADRIKLQREAGIIFRSVHQIFDSLENNTSEYSVRVSHLELYNEDLCDLINTQNGGLKLFEDPKAGVQVHNLEEIPVYNPQDIFNILEKTWEERKTAETNLNKCSSRSHCIFSITIHIKESTVNGEDLIKVGKLNLVDLAGSENINRSGADRDFARKQEAGNINKSLLTLGRVITALTEGAPHVPYRESKLTRLLRDSLGGRTKTCIIATISPSSGNLEETISTLEYACRAKNIKNRPEVNQKMAKREVIKEYTTEINALRSQLECMRHRSGVYLPLEMYSQMENDTKDAREKIVCLEEFIEKKSKDFDELNELFGRQSQNIEKTQQKLSEAEKMIEETTNELLSTNSELNATRDDLDEHKILLNEHQNTEIAFHQEASVLLSILSTSIADVKGLFSKLDRVDMLQVENQNLTANVCKEILSKLDDIRDAQEIYVSQYLLSFQQIDQSGSEYVQHHHDQVRMLQDDLNNMKDYLCTKNNQISELSKSYHINILEKFSSMKNLEISFDGTVQEHMIDYINSTCAGLNDFAKNNQDHVRMMEEKFREQRQIADEHHSSIFNFSKDQLTALHDMDLSVDAHAKKQNNKLVENERLIHELVQHHTENLNKFRSDLFSTITHAFDTFTRQQNDSMNATIHSIFSQLNETRTESNSFKEDTKHWISLEQNRINEFLASETVKNKSSIDVIDLQNNVMQRLTDSTHLNVNKLKSSISDRHRLVSNEINDHCKLMMQHQDQAIEMTNHYASEHINMFDESIVDTDHMNKNLTDDLVAHESSMNSFHQKWHHLVTEGANLVDHSIESLSGKIDAVGYDVNGFNLTDYQPTGSTPSRKSFTYNEKLSRTRPHDVILKEVYAARLYKHYMTSDTSHSDPKSNPSLHLSNELGVGEMGLNEGVSSNMMMDHSHADFQELLFANQDGSSASSSLKKMAISDALNLKQHPEHKTLGINAVKNKKSACMVANLPVPKNLPRANSSITNKPPMGANMYNAANKKISQPNRRLVNSLQEITNVL